MIPYLLTALGGYLIGSSVKQYADGGQVQLLAPNGKPSNLTPEQYKLVRTPEFKAWFGDWENDAANASKVVDDNGEPNITYHYNLNGDNTFTIFKPQSFGSYGKNSMFYFADDVNWVKAFAKRFAYEKKAKPRKFFINIKNPLDLQDLNFIAKEWIKYLDEKGLLIDSTRESLEKAPTSPFYRSEIKSWKLFRYDFGEFVQRLKDKGYDGIFITDSNYGSKGSNISFVAISPNQIKLADGSNTTFDGNNPDIRYDYGGIPAQ